MKQLQQLDPSAVDSIEFNIKSVKKYTSVFTIVLSFLIIMLSIVINVDSLQEIYAPRSELPVESVKLKQTDQTFSDQPICVTYLAEQAVPAHLYIYYQIGNTGTYGNKSIPQDNSLKGFEYMRTYIGERGFQCFNLKGVSVKPSDQIRLVCLFPSSTQILIGSHTLENVQKEKQQQVLVVEGFKYIRQIAAMKYLMTTNMFILKEKLQVNYEPEILYTLSNKILKSGPVQYSLPEGEVRIGFQDNYLSQPENYMSISYTFTRRNIAQILGNVLAWRGLILIPIAIMLMLFPVVEKFYKFDLIKARLDSEVLNNANFNIFTDIKRRLAGCCPGSFHQGRVIEKAIQKIDQQLDLISILQLQTVMRRQRAQFNQIERQQDIFDCKIEQKDIKKDMLLESADANNNIPTHATIAANKTQQIFSKNQQQSKSSIISLIQSFLYTFDDTETSVSISTNQGKGYGSVWSLFSFLLLTAAIITMLLLLGVFNISDDNQDIDAYALDQAELTINIPSYHLGFKFTHVYQTPIPKAYLVDKEENIIREVGLVQNQQCLNLIASKDVSLDDWYCIPTDVVISGSDENYAALKVVPTYDDNVTQTQKSYGEVHFMILSQSLQDQSTVQYQGGYQGQKRYDYKIKKIVKMTDNVRSQGYQMHSVEKYVDSLSHSMIYVNKGYKLREENTGSYWDIFNNTWGIVIIACDLLLFRVGRFINLKIISSRVNTEKQEKRSDILTVLFDMDRLSKGVYKQQLASVGFYYKHKLPLDSS